MVNVSNRIYVLLFLSGVSLLAARCSLWGSEGDAASPAQKDVAVWVSTESPPKTWENGYGKPFPADYQLKNVADAGFTDVFFFSHPSRGPIYFYYNTNVEYAGRSDNMQGREWIEDTLAAADKYNLKVWLTITPSCKVNGTSIAGLDDSRMIKLWCDIVEEWGKVFKPRHKSLYGIMLHEVDCAEGEDTHSSESMMFSNFCQKNFGEKYTGDKMPTGKGVTKWDRRFYLYKNEAVNNFSKALRDTAAKYGMKTAFCLYNPEQYTSNSAIWGYDTLALEKIVDRLWILDYYDLKGGWVEIGPSYMGVNMPYKEMLAFHGKPVSVFEDRVMLVPEVIRQSQRKYKKFTDIYGSNADWLAVAGKSQKVLDLFTGVGNVRKWNDLQGAWTGAATQAKIALLASSVPFVLRYPDAPGVKFNSVFKNLKDEMKKCCLADSLLIGSEFTLDPQNLAKYDLLIIPEEMGIGVDEAFFKSLKAYAEKGGKVLAIGTPLTVGSSDLTVQQDCMEELFGVKINKFNPRPADILLESAKFPLAAKKIKGACRDISATTAEKIMISDKTTGKPVLTRKGNFYYLAVGYAESNGAFFNDLIENLSPQPVRLKDNTEFKLESAVKKNNMLCVSLPSEKPASGILSVDTEKIGLKGDIFEVRNIVTGKTICNANADELKKGIKVKTEYDSEPYVLAIGPGRELACFSGIYPDNKVFADMGKVEAVENPQVAIMVPNKPGIKVGIYQSSYGAKEIYAEFDKTAGFNCFYLPRLDAECLSLADVIVIPQPTNDIFFQNATKVIMEMVRSGKGLMLTHNAVVDAYKMFPDVVGKNTEKIMGIKDNRLKIALAHPASASFKPDDCYTPGFEFDHYALSPGKKCEIIAKDKLDNPVVIAGGVGKGRIIVNGTLPGKISVCENPVFVEDKKMEGRELQFLIDSVKWLAGDKASAAATK